MMPRLFPFRHVCVLDVSIVCMYKRVSQHSVGHTQGGSFRFGVFEAEIKYKVVSPQASVAASANPAHARLLNHALVSPENTHPPMYPSMPRPKKKRAGGSGGGNAVVELTEKNFKEMVLDSDEMWLVEFFAPWCGHCQKLAPEWESAAGQLSGSVNVS